MEGLSWGACRPGRVLQSVLTSSLPLVCGWHDAPCPSARTPVRALPHGAPGGAPCSVPAGPVDSLWPGKCSSLPGQVRATCPQAALTVQERGRVARDSYQEGDRGNRAEYGRRLARVQHHEPEKTQTHWTSMSSPRLTLCPSLSRLSPLTLCPRPHSLLAFQHRQSPL